MPESGHDHGGGAGTLRFAHFTVVDRLGEGGMGIVYRAKDEKLGRVVALKVLPPEFEADPVRRARFIREARAAAAVTHANIVTVYEIGEDRDRIFVAMELVDGRPLRKLIEDGPLSTSAVLRLMLQIAAGLAKAHELGIVHRDVKPENTLVTADQNVKVLDFGLAKQPGGEGMLVTGDGTVLGTPAYMSPEQLHGEAVTPATDVFALGIMLYELLTGRRPFTGDTLLALVRSMERDTPPPPSALNALLPAAFDAIVARCLAKDPGERYADARGLLADLQRLEAASARTSLDSTIEKPIADLRGTGAAGESTAGVTADGKRGTGGRPRRRAGYRAALVGAACAAALVGGFAAYRAVTAPRIRLCAFVEASIDGRRCGIELSPEQAARRIERTARVREIGGRVAAVEWVNFRGTQACTPPWNRESWCDGLYTEEVVRGPGGDVVEVVRKDDHGNVVRREKWSDHGLRIDLVDVDGVTPRTEQETRISTIRCEYDARGLVSRETYFGPSGRPRADARGAYGYAFERGRSGRTTKETVLAADGAPGADAHGLATTVFSDDDTPEGRTRTYFDVDGQPVLVDGVFRAESTLDDAFDSVESKFFGAHGEPAVRLTDGAHAWVRRWATVGTSIDETILDERERVRESRSEGGWIERKTIDPRGRIVLDEYLDANGNRITPTSGGSIRYGWNDRNDRTRVDVIAADGTLTQGKWDYARRDDDFDDHGWLVAEHHYDETGKLAPWKEGPPVYRYGNDERGLTISTACFDENDRPAVDIHGWHQVRESFDRLRNRIEVRLFGADGHPTADEAGVSLARWAYDDNDDLVSTSYYDESATPLMYRGEFATVRFAYDDRGLPTSTEYLDTHGNRTLGKGGYATVRYLRDRSGDVVEEAYFGRHDEPIARTDGYARKTMKYDRVRRVVETRLFDAAGTPTPGGDGWAIERTTYDERGLVVRLDHLDAAEQPVITKDGSASIARRWDLHGNLVEEATLDAHGRPVVARVGYATKRSAYDGADLLVEEALFDVDGKPVNGKDGWSVRRVRHDGAGNVVEEAYFDGNLAAVAPAGTSYASVRRRFDARRRLVETSFFDAGGAAAKGSEGAATVRYQRDAYGRAMETAYFDATGMPVASKDGFVVVRRSFDPAGRVVDERFVDGSGAPRVANDGCYGHHRDYDVHGRKTKEVCLDAGGGPALSRAGFAVERIVRDAKGNAVDVSTYDVSGQRCADKEGIALRHNSYDERNLLLATRYFGPGDQPTHDRRGVHETRFVYGETGHLRSTSYFDERGRALTLRDLPSASVTSSAKENDAEGGVAPE